MKCLQPIGVFDSGVGGISVLQHIKALLPGENLVYIADSGNAPYGEKTADYVTARAVALTRYLVDRRAKAIVVACNSATADAIATLREEFRLPIIGIEPAIKPAAASTESGVIGIMATRRTLRSQKFTRLKQHYEDHVRVVLQACPGLVEQVERGDFASSQTVTLVQQYTNALLEQQVDIILLGCTHYPFLIDQIAKAAGPKVKIIEPGPAVARQLAKRLEEEQLLNPERSGGQAVFLSSSIASGIDQVISKLWQQSVQVEYLKNT